MFVTMLRDKFGADRTLYLTGQTYDVSDDLGLRFVGEGAATTPARPVINRTVDLQPLSVPLSGVVSGGGIDVSFLRDFDGAALGYTLDAGSGQVLPVMRVTVEAATTVIAGARISSGGINTFETTITGAATQGEVIPISVGAARITRVHVGLSTGTAQTLSGDATVTTNELASWSCLEADDCNVVFVRFSPPRSSGRLCDVTIVGKARA